MAKHDDIEQGKVCFLKDFIIPSTVAFVVLNVFEFLFHGRFTMPLYEMTSDLWRDPETMKQLWHISINRTIVISSMLAVLYYYFAKHSVCGGRSVTCGIRFGIIIGLLFGFNDFGAYAWMPIPIELAYLWLFGGVIAGLLVGVSLSLVRGCVCKKG
jgi:sterol desaturase/sphingolipid hydroxylase (fatty acid hydroxylase superfamily)